MKRFGLIFILVFFFSALPLTAKEKPRIGVLRFTNAGNWYWWTSNTAYELSDLLASELVSTGSFRVLERKEIDAALREQDLGASGRVDPSTAAKIGKVLGAQYLVAATVSAFEHSTKGTKGGISIKGFRLGGKKEKAYIAVDLKVIDATTGEIVDARTIEARAKSGGLSVGGWFKGVGGDLATHAKTPTGKAIRACIIEIAEYLECSLVKGKNHPCMDSYRAKEERRRERTKGAIELE